MPPKLRPAVPGKEDVELDNFDPFASGFIGENNIKMKTYSVKSNLIGKTGITKVFDEKAAKFDKRDEQRLNRIGTYSTLDTDDQPVYYGPSCFTTGKKCCCCGYQCCLYLLFVFHFFFSALLAMSYYNQDEELVISSRNRGNFPSLDIEEQFQAAAVCSAGAAVAAIVGIILLVCAEQKSKPSRLPGKTAPMSPDSLPFVSSPSSHWSFKFVDLCLFGCLLTLLLNLQYPNESSLLLVLVTISMNLLLFVRVSFADIIPVIPDSVLNDPAFSPLDDERKLNNLNNAILNRIMTNKVRFFFQHNLTRNRWKFPAVVALLLALGLLNYFAFYFETTGQSDAVYNPTISKEMNDYQAANFSKPLNNQSRVVIMVLDGLRFDMTNQNTDFRNFLSMKEFNQDARIYRMRVQLPSMSVPNWITTVTGSPPEMTGVLGNLLVPEQGYDSLFRSAERVGDCLKDFDSSCAENKTTFFKRGLTGSPWWKDILLSTLPPLQGSGVVSTSFRAGDWATADNSDLERFRIAKYAVSQEEDPYRLFLIHLSDVDMQGHEWGLLQPMSESYDEAPFCFADDWPSVFDEDFYKNTNNWDLDTITEAWTHSQQNCRYVICDPDGSGNSVLCNTDYGDACFNANCWSSGSHTILNCLQKKRHDECLSYSGAVSNVTRIVAEMWEAVKNHSMADDTTLIIVADHGHIDAGGHGGPNPYLLNVPLIVYRKHSGLGDPTIEANARDSESVLTKTCSATTSDYFTETDGLPNPLGAFQSSYYEWHKQCQQINNTFVAPTIAGLLGIPVPRQAVGYFINDLIPYFRINNDPTSDYSRKMLEDLFLQKQKMVHTFLEVANGFSIEGRYITMVDADGLEISVSNKDFLTMSISNSLLSSDIGLIIATESLLSMYYEHRETDFGYLRFRNFVCAAIILVVWLLILLDIVRKSTFMDISLLFVSANEICVESSGDETGASKTTQEARQGDPLLGFAVVAHREAFLMAFMYVSIYLLLAYGFYLISYQYEGYVFDSTVIHTPSVVPTYVFRALVPAMIISFFFKRYLHYKYVRYPLKPLPTDGMYAWFKYYSACLGRLYYIGRTVRRAEINDFYRIYLTRNFLAFISVFVFLFLLVVQGYSYGFVLPKVFETKYVDDTGVLWSVRFQVLTSQFMCFPLLYGLIQMLTDWPDPSTEDSSYDDLYVIKAVKDLRWLDRAENFHLKDEHKLPVLLTYKINKSKKQLHLFLEILTASSVWQVRLNKFALNPRAKRFLKQMSNTYTSLEDMANDEWLHRLRDKHDNPIHTKLMDCGKLDAGFSFKAEVRSTSLELSQVNLLKGAAQQTSSQPTSPVNSPAKKPNLANLV